MSLQLASVLTGIRNQHPGFHKIRVPDKVLADFLSDYQNELIGKAARKDASYLSQSLAIALTISDADDPGTAGAGTTGGLPLEEAPDGSTSLVQESTGHAIRPLRTSEEDGVVVEVPERVVTAATSTTVSSTGAGRTVNGDVGKLLRIVGGKGLGQERPIASNTAEQWTVAAANAWTTLPDTTSLMTVVEPSATMDAGLAVITELPALSSRTGYLVRLNAQGVAYIDYTKPLTVWVDRGVPLPPNTAIIAGTVRYIDSEADAEPLVLTSFGRRFDPPGFPAAYRVGEQLFLCGTEMDWSDVTSIELRYVPIAPAFTATSEYFLVPDAARSAIIARGAEFTASRVDALGDIKIDVDRFERKAVEAERDYLSTLRLSKRGRTSIIREGVY